MFTLLLFFNPVKSIFVVLKYLFIHQFNYLLAITQNRKPDKLNLGCGFDHLEGFENIDIQPITKPDILLDLRRNLPYKDNTISFIFSEHTFEHFSPDTLQHLFSECFRTLKPEGKLSFSIPDFTLLTKALLYEEKSKIADLYKKELKDVCNVSFSSNNIEIENSLYLNHLIRQWEEHKYFYTYPFLEEMLKKAGFLVVKKRKYNKEFENSDRKHTSLFVEAQK
jgi:predicted SAM-dependent methyltransferase